MMNKKELIKNLIQEIYAITNRFDNPEHIHSIDIDLALSKVRNLYELLLKLNSKELYSAEYQKEEILTISEQVKQKNKIVSSKEQSNIESTNSTQHEVLIPEIKHEELSNEKEPEQKEIIIQKSEDKKTEIKKEHEFKHNETTPEIIADKFQSKRFIHDTISKKNVKKDVSSKMQSKPIKDINSAIGLNDKFIFIRELFENNKEIFNETIQVLNNFDTYENAVDFLDENFNWDSEDPNYERLKELVRRKYS